MDEPHPAQERDPAAIGSAERRAFVRYASDRDATCRGASDFARSAKVHDISKGGVGLLLQHRFRPGTPLLVELKDGTGATLAIVPGEVVHATAVFHEGHPSWLVGCKFGRLLTDEELRALLP